MKVVYDTWSPREINREDIENKLKELSNIEEKRKVRPKSILVSEFYGPGGGDWIGLSLDYEYQVRRYNGILLKDAVFCKTKCKDKFYIGYDARLYPIIPEHPILIHQAALDCDGLNIDDLVRKNKVIGDPDIKIPTYLKLEDASEDIGTGSRYRVFSLDLETTYTMKVWFHISTAKLLKYRNIFYDPEGIGVDGEYEKTFIVFGGIPAQTIEDVSVSVSEPKPTLEDLKLELEKRMNKRNKN